MAGHTPTPWVIAAFGAVKDANRDVVSVKGFAGSGGNVGQEQAEANAAFIVKAVNAHDDLVAALQLVKGSLKFDRDDDVSREVMRRLDAALASVEA